MQIAYSLYINEYINIPYEDINVHVLYTVAGITLTRD